MSALVKKVKAARSGAALVYALALMGCGTTQHVHAVEEREAPAESLDEAPRAAAASRSAPIPVAHPEARVFGARYATPEQCEAAARELQASSRDQGWSALKSCVERTHFTLMGALLADAWSEDLRTRPDAAQLIAQVVAKRGGSVEGELRILNDRKVPIFGLSAAIAQPDTYKGRYLLLRAQVADVRSEGDQPTVWLVEEGLSSVERDRPVGYTTHRDSVRSHSGSLGGDVGLLGRSNLGGHLSSSVHERRSTSVPTYDNISEETGREALGRLARPDPFFAPGKDFVVLARFDGLRVTSSGDDDEDADAPKLPVLSIVGYYSPHPLVMY